MTEHAPINEKLEGKVRNMVFRVARELNTDQQSPFKDTNPIHTNSVLQHIKNSEGIFRLSDIRDLIMNNSWQADDNFLFTIWGETFIKLLGNPDEYPNVAINDHPFSLKRVMVKILVDKHHNLVHQLNYVHDRKLVHQNNKVGSYAEDDYDLVKKSSEFVLSQIYELLNL